MKRNIKNKPKSIECAICKKQCSAYSMSSHIKHAHKEILINEYVSLYGEFRKIKHASTRNLSRTVCEICNNEYSTVGMFVHLRDEHDLSPDEYAKHYAEYRPSKISYNLRSTDKFKCYICNETKFSNHIQLAHHIRVSHNVPMQQYALEYIFSGVYPKCKCGCGNDMKITPRPPYRTNYILGHAPNGMSGRRHKQTSKEIMSAKSISRMSKIKGKFTKPELKFKALLESACIKYKTQVNTKYGVIDFCIDGIHFIEIDGTYWHPLSLINMNAQLLQSAINDRKKNINIPEIIRIREDNIPDHYDINTILKNNEVFKYPISLPAYKEVLLQKDYLIHLRETDTPQYKKIPFLILKLIRTFETKFPKMVTTETLETVLNIIPKKINMPSDNVFNNNCSNLGVELIKSKSNSYWKSSYRGKMSPMDVWNDDDKMYEIIKYRIGDNKTKETFDFSQHQLLRGISANRYTISFFKPVLAASIYKYFLGNKVSPIVFDPCAGFGGRLIGFKSMYPSGTYIGIEPNIETYNELLELSKDMTNVYIHNCKLEDFHVSFDYDLAFTSIPYYNLETYSNVITYSNMEEWTDRFCGKIKLINNLALNVPINLQGIFLDFNTEYRIQTNPSHFSKSRQPKFEWLLTNF